MRIRSTGMVVAALALALALPGSAAAQETKTQTVSAEVVYTNGQRPGDPGNCSAVVFVKWADVPGTTAATAYYMFKGEERSKASTPPFDDTYEWVATYQVDPGFHWIQVGVSWSDGPAANDCSATREKYKTLISTEARVELQVPAVDEKACTAAKRARADRRKAVSKLQKKLRNAEGAKARKRINAKLKQAKTKRDNASARVKEVC